MKEKDLSEGETLTLDTLTIISAAVIDICHMPFVEMVRDVRQKRIDALESENWTEYVQFSKETSDRYQQTWLQYHAIVLQELGLTMEQWVQSFLAQNTQDRMVQFKCIPLERMNRTIPVEGGVDHVTVEDLKKLNIFQVGILRERTKEMREKLENQDDFTLLADVMSSLIEDEGFLKFGLREEHISHLAEAGEDQELVNAGMEISRRIQEIRSGIIN